MSKDNLLERCLGGHTQNANESFNATVWRLSPKHLHLGLKVVENSAYIAAGIFNKGFSSVLRIMNLLNLTVCTYAKVFAHKTDEARISRHDRKSLLKKKMLVQLANNYRKKISLLKRRKNFCMDLALLINW